MEEYKDRIIKNSEIMLGKPVIKGTRIPAELIHLKLLQGIKTEELYEAYPKLTNKDLAAVIDYAVNIIIEEEENSPETSD